MPNILQYLTLSDPNTMLTTVILPFLLIFVMLWGVLQMTRIFGHGPEAKKINVIIAIVITLFAAFTDAWGVVATQLATFSGVFVYVVFFGVFILGVIFWAVGRGREAYSMHVSGTAKYDTVKKIDKRLKKEYEQMRKAENKGNMDLAKHYANSINELKRKRDALLLMDERR